MPPAFRPGKKILPKASAKSDRTQLSKEIFWQFAKAGNTLANLHINYEKQAEIHSKESKKANSITVSRRCASAKTSQRSPITTF